MNFTEEHLPILEQHKHHWIGLRDLQIMRNLDGPIIQSLQVVFNQAVGPQKFPAWCKDCVCEMVRLLYVNFEKWQEQQPPKGAEPPATPKGKGGKRNQNKEDGE